MELSLPMLPSKHYRLLIVCLLLLASLSAKGQDDDPGKWAFKGYLKNMSTFSWTPYFADTLWYDNLTHNRLNMAWYPNDEFSLIIEMRNRLFLGSSVKTIPDYGELIDANNDFFDLSYTVYGDNAVLNMMFDRLYVQWVKNNWELKLGRQRINWGVNLAWNPNDWFNAYSFFDFDYEERPGSDAFRATYYTGVASSIEVAAKIADRPDDFVAAGMYKMNKWNYDLQFLGGLAQGDVALGTGWAGNLGLASLKGELTYFIPVIETEANTNFLRNPLNPADYIKDANGNRIKESERYASMFLGAISADYSFQNSLYLNGSVMYSSIGDYNADLFGNAISQQLGDFTVRDLSPYPWSSFVQVSYQFTPLLFGGGAVMFYPGTNNFFINPWLTYSILTNLDLDVVGQVFYGDNLNGSYDAISKSMFVRMKWSF
jgi:hypothetical protein